MTPLACPKYSLFTKKTDLRIFPAKKPMSHLSRLTLYIAFTLSKGIVRQDNLYTVSFWQIYAFGNSISNTYHIFIAYERKSKILFCRLRYNVSPCVLNLEKATVLVHLK